MTRWTAALRVMRYMRSAVGALDHHCRESVPGSCSSRRAWRWLARQPWERATDRWLVEQRQNSDDLRVPAFAPQQPQRQDSRVGRRDEDFSAVLAERDHAESVVRRRARCPEYFMNDRPVVVPSLFATQFLLSASHLAAYPRARVLHMHALPRSVPRRAFCLRVAGRGTSYRNAVQWLCLLGAGAGADDEM